MKPGKYQRSKQRCQDLGWKVHDRAQSFVLHELVTYKYVTNPFLLASSSSEQLLCFVQIPKTNPYNKEFCRVS